jgi:protein phosphatase
MSVPASSGSATPSPYPRLTIDVGGSTHVGKVRENNEDAYFVGRMARYVEKRISNVSDALLPARREEGATIMMVADGMGGMAAGEVASHHSIVTAMHLITEAPRWALRLDDPATREAEIEAMWGRARKYLENVHATIRREAASSPKLVGMGTTLTGAYTVGSDLFVLHVGDSRAYLHRAGTVERITRDHTLAQSYVELGILREDEAESHRLSHVLTQAVGGPTDEVQADLYGLTLLAGDRLVLCTDGLTNVVPEPDIARVLDAGAPSQAACDALIQLALDRGGPDNITVIVASFGAPAAGA